MKTIAVIFGGRSTEHDVSIVTALSSIIKPLELTGKYKVEPVYISKDGSWYWDKKLKDISLFTTGKVSDLVRKSSPVKIRFDSGLMLMKSGNIPSKNKTSKIDVVFPSMHGTYGEDGSLMGLLEMANIPYVGCGLRASVLAMDKVLAKQTVNNNGLPITKYISLKKTQIEGEEQEHIEKITKDLKYPLFVKPAHLGSSIGISRVKNKQELKNAVEVAAHYDDTVLIEEEVPNLIEVTMPVLGNDDPLPGLLERPLSSAEEFFDFETKYMQNKKNGGQKSSVKGAQGYSELPAKLDKSLYTKAKKTGLKAYKALGCEGIARIDMLIDGKAGKVYFNEVNPLPGGLYAHNWQAAGISKVELVDKLVNLAVEKHSIRQQIATSFDTNYLKQF